MQHCIRDMVASTGTTLMDLHGIGPSGAARLLVEVGEITRFPTIGEWRPAQPMGRTTFSIGREV
jgi:hypothetical protein